MLRANKADAYQTRNFREMLSLVEKVKTKEIENKVISIDDVYVYVHIMAEYTMSLGPIIKVRRSSDSRDYDIDLSIYPDFFKLPDVNCKIYMLAYGVGMHKKDCLLSPSLIYDNRKSKALRVGRSLEEDLLADIYAAKAVPMKAKLTMLKIADYIENHMQWEEGALDMRIRAYQQPAA